MNQPIRILIVDDHPILRLGISAMIQSQPEMDVVGQAATASEAIRIFQDLQPDVSIVDLRLPDVSGAELIRHLHPRFPAAAFLVLTTYEGDEDIFQALQAGATGYLIKGMSQESLIRGIYAVYRGKRYLPDEIQQKLKSRDEWGTLSEREREVLQLLFEGLSNKSIAAQLGVTEATVKCHVGVILASLQAEDRLQAVMIAMQRGLVHL